MALATPPPDRKGEEGEEQFQLPPSSPRLDPGPVPNDWVAKLIVFVAVAITILSIGHYLICMLSFRHMEWQFYISLVKKDGIEKVGQINPENLTDSTCVDANRVSISTLTGLLATILALRIKA